ncbi:alpha/beta-hydrolase [Mytilinidion resinicola]|uniref:Alpha/beta-hydrolase n=1 Tax=Mytilinidion resinicola TaxID=574789 RepID=A0A6A6Z7F6_9PEZI|nr:alpha/beta-hydrolase [Mytilinidion resinicola]KAF2816649.1 alpha/beta-hydrolase [Mytilinidion resinicola]
MSTAQTAKTQYVTAANGTKFAYRRIGASTGIPLVTHIHYRANMDFWDPLFINTLAANRPVIVFDQSGVGRSTGEIPNTFQGWANDLIAFVKALGLAQIDLLGFSMGGCAVQMVALTAPELIRKLIIAGSAASVPTAETVTEIVWPQVQADPKYIINLNDAVTPEEVKYTLEYTFFPEDKIGRDAAEAYWKRVLERNVADEPKNLELVDRDTGAKVQLAAFLEDWIVPNPRNSFDRLGELKMPVLVMNGGESP